MILVSGPPCSGKTTLINSKGSIKNILGLEWQTFVNANEIRKTPVGSLLSPTTVVHYDNLRPFKRRLPGFSAETDVFLEQVSLQKNIQLITVLAPLQVMIQRLVERKERLKATAPLTRIKKIDKVIKLYNQPDDFLKIITEWLFFCETLNSISHHFYLNSDSSTKTLTGINFEQIIKPFLLSTSL